MYSGHQGGTIFATTGLGILATLLGTWVNGWLGNLLLGTSEGASVSALTTPILFLAITDVLLLIFI